MFNSNKQSTPSWGVEDKKHKSWGRKIAITGGVLFGLMIVGSIVDDGDTSSTASPEPSVTVTETAKARTEAKAKDLAPIEDETERADAAQDTGDYATGTDTASFVMAVKLPELDTFKDKSDDELVSYGKESCNLLDQGVSEDDVPVKLAAAHGGNMFAYSYLMGAAESAFCPEYLKG